jgi:PPP family 3-phenylpropionic acid transporter
MGGTGAFTNYINLYLEQVVGFTGSQIGLVTMISMGFIIVVNPILGYVGDKTGKHVLILKCAFFLTTVFTVIYSQSNTFFMILIMAILLEISRACIPPFFDLITSDYCYKVGFDFGKVRVFASIGFMITVMSIGFIIAGVQVPWLNGQTIGFDGFLSIRTAVFGAIIILLGLSFILMFFVPSPEDMKSKGSPTAKFNRQDIKALFENKRLRFILVFIILSLVALESAKTFVGNHLVVGLGSAENIVSLMTFVMVLPELILLPFGSKIIRKVGFKNLYIFSSLTMLGRTLIYSYTSNIAVFAAVSLVHGFGVMTHVSGNIAFIRKVVEPKVLGLAFTIMVSVLGFGRAIMSYIYGLLYEHFDGFAVFRLATVLLFCGFLWVLNSKCLKEVGDEITSAS